LDNVPQKGLAMLEVEGFHAYYGDREVVRDVNLSFDYGQITLLLGHNGAGKSTLLHSMLGLVSRTQGSIQLDDQELRGLPATATAKAGLALVPQGQGVFHELSVEDNVKLAVWTARRSGRAGSRQDENGRLDSAFTMFPVVTEAWKRLAGTLSGGQQQQLAIARGVLANPRVLLLDEPSVGLSPNLVEKTLELVAGLRGADRVIVLVEQNVHQALYFADVVHVIKAGEVVASGLGPSEIGSDQLTLLF